MTQVLLAQLDPSPGEPAQNAAAVGVALKLTERVDLAVLPEMFLGGYDLSQVEQSAVEIDSPEVAAIRGAAAANSTAVLVGLAERRAEGIANSLLAIEADGQIAGVHRKTTLWGGERDLFEAGQQLTIVNLAGRRIGLMLCYEIEFPEIARALALAGADLLVTASANMAPYYDDHELASRARALDNRLSHVYVNRVGSQNGLDFVGGSRLVDSGGAVVASADGIEQQSFVATALQQAPAAGSVDYLNNLPTVTDVVTEAPTNAQPGV